MGRSNETFNKKEKEKNRLKKRKDKEKKREDRKSNPQGGGLDDMIAYVDENGRLTSTPPDPSLKTKVVIEDIEISVPKKEDREAISAYQGRVDFFDPNKGFGFIKETVTQERYFVHVNGLLEPIKEKDLVTFELQRGLKGMNAVMVKKV